MASLAGEKVVFWLVRVLVAGLLHLPHISPKSRVYRVYRVYDLRPPHVVEQATCGGKAAGILALRDSEQGLFQACTLLSSTSKDWRSSASQSCS